MELKDKFGLKWVGKNAGSIFLMPKLTTHVPQEMKQNPPFLIVKFFSS